MKLPQPRKIGLYFWLIVAILAIFNIAKSLRVDQNHDQPVDFRQLYLAGCQILAGNDPYDDDAIKIRWQEMAIQESLTSSRIPGFPQNGVVYPLHTLYAFSPLALMPWKTARIFWWLCIGIACLAGARLFQYSLFPSWSLVQILALMLVFKGTFPALMIGQPLWLALVGLGMVLYAEKKKWPMVLTIGVIIMSLKVSLLPPLFAWWLIRGKWKNILVNSGVLLFGVIIMALISPDFGIRLEHMFSNMDQQWANAYALGAFNGLAVNLTELGLLLPHGDSPLKIVNLAGLVSSYGLAAAGFFYWKKKNPKPFEHHGPQAIAYRKDFQKSNYLLLSLLFGASLLWSYHLIYDALPFLILLTYVVAKTPSFRLAVMLFSLPLVVPVNGLLGENPWAFHLTVTLTLLFLLTLCIFFVDLFQRKQ